MSSYRVLMRVISISTYMTLAFFYHFENQGTRLLFVYCSYSSVCVFSWQQVIWGMLMWSGMVKSSLQRYEALFPPQWIHIRVHACTYMIRPLTKFASLVPRPHPEKWSGEPSRISWASKHSCNMHSVTWQCSKHFTSKPAHKRYGYSCWDKKNLLL